MALDDSKICCGNCGLKTGGILVGVFLIVTLLVVGLDAFVMGYVWLVGLPGLICAVLLIPACVCHFVAVCRNHRHLLLIPTLICLVLVSLMFIARIVISIGLVVERREYGFDEYSQDVVYFFGLPAVIFLALSIWSFVVTLSLYRFFRQQRLNLTSPPGDALMAQAELGK